MSRVLYFDCFSGISGDMALGALIDAGLPVDALRQALGSLALGDAHIHVDRVLRAGVAATKFSVHEHAHDRERHEHAHDHGHHEHLHDHGRHGHAHEHGDGGHHHPHRSLPDIYALIDASALPATARARAKSMFERLAEAEAAIHQMPVEQVHLHEVGALDSIIDICGIAFAMEWVGADRVVCSPLNVGGGMVQSAHGHFPVPAPATVRLLGAAPIYSGAVQKELVTPTGALIATTFASAFGPIPSMTVERVGYGAGDRDEPSTPNVLRVLIGAEAAAADAGDRVVVVECEIDDMNPQIFGVAMERLYAAGALEVFYVAVQMKKNRPGTLLTVIAPPDRRAAIADVIFAETTTIGLRHSEVSRLCLTREIVRVDTPLGPVRFKVASRDGRVVNAQPEFDDCAALAAQHNRSVKDVQAIAIRAFQP
ncbi:MAG TPA: nickel pincer cofactor biosynthesis protein LarC [Vicinamibacterales bacterium]|nr:nickel pincer cofactor biosynthesis protein LarC [Vicinamibacterales bacterium]